MLDLSTITDYSWAQIKLAAKQCMASNLVGGANLTIGGRSLGRCTPEQAMKLYEWADAMELAETYPGGGIVLGKFGEAV